MLMVASSCATALAIDAFVVKKPSSVINTFESSALDIEAVVYGGFNATRYIYEFCDVTIANNGGSPDTPAVSVTIFDGLNNIIASGTLTGSLLYDGDTETLEIPLLWDVDESLVTAVKGLIVCT